MKHLSIAGPALAMLLATTACAMAEEFCIGSVAELRQALAIAENNGQDDWLKLRVGNYPLDAPLVHHTRDGRQVTLDGGYQTTGAGACAVQHMDPARTVIDGQRRTAVIAFSNADTSLGFVLRRLSLRNGIAGAQRSPVSIRGTGTSTGAIHLLGVRIQGMTGDLQQSPTAIEVDAGAGTLRINNSVFTGNISADATAAIRLRVNGVGRTYVTHNSFVANAFGIVPIRRRGDDGSPPIISFAGSGSWELDNNLIWSEAPGPDLQAGSNMRLRDNLIRSFEGTPGAGSGGNFSDHPRFVADFDDVRLMRESPAINAGRTDPIGGSGSHDAWGQPRVVNGAPDIGAYEHPGEPIFRDGFQEKESM